MESYTQSTNFIQNIINEDLQKDSGYNRIHTRFPPEPNGYLHIGHAKSICLNFGLAIQYDGLCNLRFDDTNPIKEEVEYVDSIINDVRWLGFDWDDRLYYASDYFEIFYDYAIMLIKKGVAYVCELTAEEIRKYRGTLTEPGRKSPFRNRPFTESLDLFQRMRAGEFADGSKVLRAKIDMDSPNINMRDPVLYRIMKADHHRTGDKWCVYPMYDFAHPLSDAIEGITHSICTLEFEDHRPLYNWVLEQGQEQFKYLPKQIEFARLNLTNTLMSKRLLRNLVEEGQVSGWDDPRMPTITGLRRRGYTPGSIRDFCSRIGVAKSNSTVDVALLEHCVREDLNQNAARAMAVLKPLKIVITNYPEGQYEELMVDNHPNRPEMGNRKLRFDREVYIEQEDFLEEPPKKFFRLSPGKEVRLMHAYIIKCENVIKDPETGAILELHCTYDPETKSGSDTSGKKVKGTLHWLSVKDALPAVTRLYDHLLIGNEEKLNPNSLQVLNSFVEPSLNKAKLGDNYQFLRNGYFTLDIDSSEKELIFNRTVSLRDTWAKQK